MKKLNLLDQSTSFKVNDTGTIIPFNAYEDNQPVFATSDDTVTFRIKNEMGFLKAVNATVATGGYIFELNTKDLVGLVPGTYEIELSITNNKDNEESIFPDTGFCSFTINENALTVTGTQIPTMSLDSFKQQLEQYVQAQTATKIQGIEDDFKSYVASVKEGPQGEVGPAGNDGKAATITIGTTTTADVGESANVTNSGTDNNAVLNFTIPRGEQGPKGDTGASSTVNVDTADSYTPWTAWDSQGTTYSKGYIGNDGNENPGNATDVYTDYIECYQYDMYTISLPGNLLPFPQGAALRVAWYDTNKNFISAKEIRGITPPYAWTVSAPQNAKNMRWCFYVGNNANANGTNPHVFITDIGHSTATNNGTSTDANIKFSVASGSQGVPGLQGAVGPQGPQGTIGDYVTGTGWVDLSPYMNTDVWCGWDSNTPSDIGYNKYAVTSINGQNIFWFRIHSRFKDASVAGKWGTKLFTIPVDVQKQYGGMEASQYQSGLYECNGQPCLSQVVGGANARYVQTRGALQMSAGGDNTSKLTGTVTVNMEGWYIL